MMFRCSTIFLFVFACLNAQGQKGIPYNQIPAGSFVLLTNQLHDSWAEWSTDNKKIYSLYYSGKGVINLFELNLDSLDFKEQNKKFYAASYLTNEKSNAYKQTSFFTAGVIDSPVLSPNGKKVAFRKDGKVLMAMDLENKKADTLLHQEVDGFDYLDENKILYTLYREQIGKIYQLDLTTGASTLVWEDSLKPESVVVQDKEIFVTYKDSICIYNAADFKLKDAFSAIFTGTRINRVDENTFVFTTARQNGPCTAFYDKALGKARILMNSYDYEPTLAPDKSALVFLSEGAPGMILYKIK